MRGLEEMSDYIPQVALSPDVSLFDSFSNATDMSC